MFLYINSIKKYKMELKELNKKIDSILSIYLKNKNSKLLGLLIIHNVFILICIMYLLFGKMNLIYDIVVVIMILVLLMNIKYRGCPLLKLERKYMESKEWYGGYHSLELLGIKPNNENIKGLFKLWVLLIGIVVIYRKRN